MQHKQLADEPARQLSTGELLMYNSPPRFVALDFYRYVAAAGVVLLHYSQFGDYNPNTGFGYLVGNFALFVDFFFILSGFVIGVNYFGQVNAFGEIIAFWRKRLARVYPLHLLTLFIFAIPVIIGSSHHAEKWTLHSVAAEVLLAQSWPLHAPLPINFPSWSISVEWAMYLAFPLLVLVARRRFIALGGIILLGMFATQWLLWSGAVDPPLWVMLANPIRAVPTFTAGVLISQVFKSVRIQHGIHIGFAAFIAAILLMTIHANLYLVLIAFSLAILATASGYALQTQASFLDHPFCRLVGDCSYSVYMLHAAALTIAVRIAWPRLSGAQPSIWFGVLVLVLITLVSIASYRYFEIPAKTLVMMKLRRPSLEHS